MKNNIKKGRLTIYTSYSPGAGKTHIMLGCFTKLWGEGCYRLFKWQGKKNQRL